jgi:DNA-binding NarL/FixJ family response regulator
MTSIVIADDHVIVRQRIRALLEQEADFSVVGEAGDGLRAIEITKRLKPDVLVLDINMPSKNGIEVAEHVRHEGLRTRIVILTTYPNESYLLDALRNNVHGYILKTDNASLLVHCKCQPKRDPVR